MLYMVPTKAFQLHYYAQRSFIHQILEECDDPERAFENWMMRDHQFGQEILRQAQARNYAAVLVDGARDMDEQYIWVKDYFGLK